jgi:endonuclease YncB( thermonuclease family)
MFSVGLNQEGLIDDIRRDVTTTAALMDATGPSRVIDGDTLEIKETSYRLSGIDAPEMGQQCRNKDGTYFDCGEVARRGLEQAISGKPVECHASELDMFKRPIATCAVEGKDLAEFMIENGYAVAFRQYSQTYVAKEETAQVQDVGIWQTEFQMPWEYRKDH